MKKKKSFSRKRSWKTLRKNKRSFRRSKTKKKNRRTKRRTKRRKTIRRNTRRKTIRRNTRRRTRRRNTRRRTRRRNTRRRTKRKLNKQYGGSQYFRDKEGNIDKKKIAIGLAAGIGGAAAGAAFGTSVAKSAKKVGKLSSAAATGIGIGAGLLTGIGTTMVAHKGMSGIYNFYENNLSDWYNFFIKNHDVMRIDDISEGIASIGDLSSGLTGMKFQDVSFRKGKDGLTMKERQKQTYKKEKDHIDDMVSNYQPYNRILGSHNGNKKYVFKLKLDVKDIDKISKKSNNELFDLMFDISKEKDSPQELLQDRLHKTLLKTNKEDTILSHLQLLEGQGGGSLKKKLLLKGDSSTETTETTETTEPPLLEEEVLSSKEIKEQPQRVLEDVKLSVKIGTVVRCQKTRIGRAEPGNIFWTIMDDGIQGTILDFFSDLDVDAPLNYEQIQRLLVSSHTKGVYDSLTYLNKKIKEMLEAGEETSLQAYQTLYATRFSEFFEDKLIDFFEDKQKFKAYVIETMKVTVKYRDLSNELNEDYNKLCRLDKKIFGHLEVIDDNLKEIDSKTTKIRIKQICSIIATTLAVVAGLVLKASAGIAAVAAAGPAAPFVAAVGVGFFSWKLMTVGNNINRVTDLAEKVEGWYQSTKWISKTGIFKLIIGILRGIIKFVFTLLSLITSDWELLGLLKKNGAALNELLKTIQNYNKTLLEYNKKSHVYQLLTCYVYPRLQNIHAFHKEINSFTFNVEELLTGSGLSVEQSDVFVTKTQQLEMESIMNSLELGFLKLVYMDVTETNYEDFIKSITNGCNRTNFEMIFKRLEKLGKNDFTLTVITRIYDALDAVYKRFLRDGVINVIDAKPSDIALITWFGELSYLKKIATTIQAAWRGRKIRKGPPMPDSTSEEEEEQQGGSMGTSVTDDTIFQLYSILDLPLLTDIKTNLLELEVKYVSVLTALESKSLQMSLESKSEDATYTELLDVEEITAKKSEEVHNSLIDFLEKCTEKLNDPGNSQLFSPKNAKSLSDEIAGLTNKGPLKIMGGLRLDVLNPTSHENLLLMSVLGLNKMDKNIYRLCQILYSTIERVGSSQVNYFFEQIMNAYEHQGMDGFRANCVSKPGIYIDRRKMMYNFQAGGSLDKTFVQEGDPHGAIVVNFNYTKEQIELVLYNQLCKKFTQLRDVYHTTEGVASLRNHVFRCHVNFANTYLCSREAYSVQSSFFDKMKLDYSQFQKFYTYGQIEGVGLPDGWIEQKDDAGEIFYENEKTGDWQWDPPLLPEAERLEYPETGGFELDENCKILKIGRGLTVKDPQSQREEYLDHDKLLGKYIVGFKGEFLSLKFNTVNHEYNYASLLEHFKQMIKIMTIYHRSAVKGICIFSDRPAHYYLEDPTDTGYIRLSFMKRQKTEGTSSVAEDVYSRVILGNKMEKANAALSKASANRLGGGSQRNFISIGNGDDEIHSQICCPSKDGAFLMMDLYEKVKGLPETFPDVDKLISSIHDFVQIGGNNNINIQGFTFVDNSWVKKDGKTNYETAEVFFKDYPFGRFGISVSVYNGKVLRNFVIFEYHEVIFNPNPNNGLQRKYIFLSGIQIEPDKCKLPLPKFGIIVLRIDRNDSNMNILTQRYNYGCVMCKTCSDMIKVLIEKKTILMRTEQGGGSFWKSADKKRQEKEEEELLQSAKRYEEDARSNGQKSEQALIDNEYDAASSLIGQAIEENTEALKRYGTVRSLFEERGKLKRVKFVDEKIKLLKTDKQKLQEISSRIEGGKMEEIKISSAQEALDAFLQIIKDNPIYDKKDFIDTRMKRMEQRIADTISFSHHHKPDKKKESQYERGVLFTRQLIEKARCEYLQNNLGSLELAYTDDYVIYPENIMDNKLSDSGFKLQLSKDDDEQSAISSQGGGADTPIPKALPGHQVMLVTCPEGAKEGTFVEIMDVNGSPFKVIVPPGVSQGQTFHVQVPINTPQVDEQYFSITEQCSDKIGTISEFPIFYGDIDKNDFSQECLLDKLHRFAISRIKYERPGGTGAHDFVFQKRDQAITDAQALLGPSKPKLDIRGFKQGVLDYKTWEELSYECEKDKKKWTKLMAEISKLYPTPWEEYNLKNVMAFFISFYEDIHETLEICFVSKLSELGEVGQIDITQAERILDDIFKQLAAESSIQQLFIEKLRGLLSSQFSNSEHSFFSVLCNLYLSSNLDMRGILVKYFSYTCTGLFLTDIIEEVYYVVTGSWDRGIPISFFEQGLIGFNFKPEERGGVWYFVLESMAEEKELEGKIPQSLKRLISQNIKPGMICKRLNHIEMASDSMQKILKDQASFDDFMNHWRNVRPLTFYFEKDVTQPVDEEKLPIEANAEASLVHLDEKEVSLMSEDESEIVMYSFLDIAMMLQASQLKGNQKVFLKPMKSSEAIELSSLIDIDDAGKSHPDELGELAEALQKGLFETKPILEKDEDSNKVMDDTISSLLEFVGGLYGINDTVLKKTMEEVVKTSGVGTDVHQSLIDTLKNHIISRISVQNGFSMKTLTKVAMELFLHIQTTADMEDVDSEITLDSLGLIVYSSLRQYFIERNKKTDYYDFKLGDNPDVFYIQETTKKGLLSELSSVSSEDKTKVLKSFYDGNVGKSYIESKDELIVRSSQLEAMKTLYATIHLPLLTTVFDKLKEEKGIKVFGVYTSETLIGIPEQQEKQIELTFDRTFPEGVCPSILKYDGKNIVGETNYERLRASNQLPTSLLVSHGANEPILLSVDEFEVRYGEKKLFSFDFSAPRVLQNKDTIQEEDVTQFKQFNPAIYAVPLLLEDIQDEMMQSNFLDSATGECWKALYPHKELNETILKHNNGLPMCAYVDTRIDDFTAYNFTRKLPGNPENDLHEKHIPSPQYQNASLQLCQLASKYSMKDFSDITQNKYKHLLLVPTLYRKLGIEGYQSSEIGVRDYKLNPHMISENGSKPLDPDYNRLLASIYPNLLCRQLTPQEYLDKFGEEHKSMADLQICSNGIIRTFLPFPETNSANAG